MPVDVTHALDSTDHFLTEITSFVVVDRALSRPASFGITSSDNSLPQRAMPCSMRRFSAASGSIGDLPAIAPAPKRPDRPGTKGRSRGTPNLVGRSQKGIGFLGQSERRRSERSCIPQFRIHQMKEAECVGDIFQGDVVRDDVFLQAAGERFPQNRLGVKIKAFLRGGDKEIGAQLSFGGQCASVDRGTRAKAQDVVSELTIQKAHPIVAGDFEFCSIAKVKKHGSRNLESGVQECKIKIHGLNQVQMAKSGNHREAASAYLFSTTDR